MSSPPPIRPIAIAAAIGAIAAEFALARLGRVEHWVALPLAIVTGGAVIWVALALDALVRRQARPDRRDIVAVAELQRANATLLDAHDARLARTEELLALAAAEPALAEAEFALADATQEVERWTAITLVLPRWVEALERWSAIVDRLSPGLAPDRGPVANEEARAARERLPLTQNFSSQDLKAATTYLVHTDRLAAARRRLSDHRRAIFDRALVDHAAGRHPA